MTRVNVADLISIQKRCKQGGLKRKLEQETSDREAADDLDSEDGGVGISDVKRRNSNSGASSVAGGGAGITSAHHNAEKVKIDGESTPTPSKAKAAEANSAAQRTNVSEPESTIDIGAILDGTVRTMHADIDKVAEAAGTVMGKWGKRSGKKKYSKGAKQPPFQKTQAEAEVLKESILQQVKSFKEILEATGLVA